MGLFGVRVNGVPRFTGGSEQFPAGTSAIPGVAIGEPNSGFWQRGSGIIGLTLAGTHHADFARSGGNVWASVASDVAVGWSSGDPSSAAPDVTIVREAPNTLKIFNGSTAASTVLLGAIDFRQTASTFAQAATILNGPRAANPVAWVEVRVSGTTGRIPVW